MELTAAEGRVLGCLIEREAIDPDAYPVTLNALRLACNQSTERDPVVAYDDRTVEDSLLSLKSKGLARFTPPGKGERTTRYSHRAGDRWRMAAPELAVLSVLLVGGVQTVSEVRTRARRLAHLTDADQVDAVLDTLAARTPTPFVARLERRSADGETRWAQVLTGRPTALDDVAPGPSAGSPASAAPAQPPMVPADVASPSYGELVERLAALEQRLGAALERPAYPSSDWRSRPVPPPAASRRRRPARVRPGADRGRFRPGRPAAIAAHHRCLRQLHHGPPGPHELHGQHRPHRPRRPHGSVGRLRAGRPSVRHRAPARPHRGRAGRPALTTGTSSGHHGRSPNRPPRCDRFVSWCRRRPTTDRYGGRR